MRKLKQWLIAILVLSITLNTPACMETAEAMGQMRTKHKPAAFEMRAYVVEEEDSDEDSDEEAKQEESTVNRTEEQKPEQSQESETQSTEKSLEQKPEQSQGSDNVLEQTTEDSQTQEITQEVEDETSAEADGTTQPDAAEGETACTAQTAEMPEAGFFELEAQMELIEEQADQKDEEVIEELTEGTTEEFTLEMDKTAGIMPSVTDEGDLDYRTYIDGSVSPELCVTVEESTRIFPPTGHMNMGGGKELPASALSGIHYYLKMENAGIVSPHYMEKRCVYDSAKTCFKDAVTLDIVGVGETAYSVEPLGSCGVTVYPGYGTIKVHNSPLYDSDFYIKVSGGSHQGDYTYSEWRRYLQAHDNWVDGSVEIRLSDTGKKYFTAIETKVSGGESNEKNVRNPYTFWAENPGKNASTKEVADGTRSYTVGIDKDAPVLTSLYSESHCYEPTKTDTVQYFAEDFVLKGTFEDAGCGLDRMEYTTDATAGGNAKWTAVEGVKEGVAASDFQIRLPDGCYDAIAVRAYDRLGNVSASEGFVNEQGAYIKVVVDKAAPVMKLTATADGKPYCGDHDNWTNKNVLFTITADPASCPYAGIGQLEYKYDKIGQISNSEGTQDEWTVLSWQDKPEAELEVTDDRNGYYSFRVISKSGIMTEDIVRERILVQHQAADLKPMKISRADDTKRINEWYNKESGVPYIQFEYPEYDSGSDSGEYDAPITMHYRLTAEDNAFSTAPASVEKSVMIGVIDGSKDFALTIDPLEDFSVGFGYHADSREAQDGIYTLEYWTTDSAGNESRRERQRYKIDTHEPTDLMVMIEDSLFPVGQESTIVYEKFYQNTVLASASAQYGISGKGSLLIQRAEKPGAWRETENTGFDGEDAIEIIPDTKCFLYVRAQDQAGNVSEGWTMGVVVDHTAPIGAENMSLIMEPEGANENGFFHEDVEVQIHVKDLPEDGNCASLMSVTDSIGRDGEDTMTDNVLFAFTKEQPTDEELAQAAEFQTVQVVKAQENESNDAYIEVTAVDRAGNAKTSIQVLKIDITKPEISIQFDNHEVENDHFYRRKRTAQIRVIERNFDQKAVDITVRKNGRPAQFMLSDWTDDGIEHYAEIAFTEDGSYSIEAVCTDLAGNVSNKIETETFTIDCTAPVLQMELETEQKKVQTEQQFFNTEVTALITVTEHNFCEEDFVLNMVPKADVGRWSHDGDVHTMRITFDGESAHDIDCRYTDLAGNSSESVKRSFTIDKTVPLIAIEGIVDGSANKGTILPVVTVLDLNMDAAGVRIDVLSGMGESVDTVIETTPVEDGSGVGYRFTLPDMTDKEDNIYYLTVTACDQAGNTSELSYRFSLNRNGSVYDMRQLAHLMENQYQTVNQLDEIQIVEMNVDTVEEFDLYISRNGELGYQTAYSKEISGSEHTGYTYVYKIDKENFQEEGAYRLSLYSKDRAGNEVNNATNIRGNEISFIVDNTAPKVIIDGVESGGIYDVESQEVQVVVTDNFRLAEAEFMLVNKNREVLECWDYMVLADEDGMMKIMIPQYDGEVSLCYRVKDAAGNERQTLSGEQTAASGFLVTTDKLVQLVNKPSKTPVGRAVILVMGMAAVIALFTALRAVRRRKC